MKKIFIIGHALIEPTNRARWYDFAAQQPKIELKLLIPKIWCHAQFGNEVTTKTLPEKNDNLEIIPVTVTDREYWTRFLIPALPYLLLKERPNIIICFQEEGTVSLCWSLLCKYFFAPHAKIGFFSWQNINIHQDKWHQRLRWSLSKSLSDFFIAGTEQIKNLFEQTQYKKKIFVQTEIGVSPKIFNESESLKRNFRQKYQLNGELVLGFAGRLVAEKGIYDLTAALAQLPPELNWTMLWAGDGKERKQLEEKSNNSLFLGQLKIEEMIEFYNGIDCLILPSKTTPFWSEQFGLVIVQALACNTPVIGSSSGAIPEVINNNDYIFEEGNSTDLRNKIMDWHRGKLSAHNRAESFHTPVLAKNFLTIINSIDNNSL